MNNFMHTDGTDYYRGVTISCGQGGFVDLSNTPANGAVLARVSLDTSRMANPMVKIDFNGTLSFRLTMLEELDLVFTLFRDCGEGEMEQIASWPYKVLMDQTLTGVENEQYIFTIIEKNETISLSFCDDLACSSRCCTYVMRVESNYFNITSATMQSGVMSAIAFTKGC